jgi:hemerythrin-like domain-containing protein
VSESLTPELPGFDQPLEMLEACHQKMLEHCDLLERLIQHINEQGVDMEASGAAGRVFRYFNTSAKLHHQDEEQDLFPLLSRQTIKIAELIHGLRQDHQRMNELWSQLAPGLKRPQELEGNEALQDLAREFIGLYREHIRRENKEFIPLASHSLSTRQLKDAGDAMKRRRRST